jgi:hypothetical protein
LGINGKILQQGQSHSPGGMAWSGGFRQAMWKIAWQVFKEHDTTLTAQTYPDELEVNAIFDEMYLGLLSHVEASENILSITSSTLVTTHSSPGDWCLFMRSNSHTDAVLKILRLPLLLNEMVTDHVRNAVRFLVAKLLAKEDPLGLIG